MAYIPPEMIDPSPTGDTVKEAILKNNTNVLDAYEALNDLLGMVPTPLDPDAFYRVDGSNELTAHFQAGGNRLSNVGHPLVDTDGATQGWTGVNFLKLSGGAITGLISCPIEPTNEYHLVNKEYVDSHGGGGGDAIWGYIEGTLADQDDLWTALESKSPNDHTHIIASRDDDGFMSSAAFRNLDDMKDPALKMEFIQYSDGNDDAGKPIKLDQFGFLDVSFLSIKVFNLIGDFTPTPAEEYPSPATGGDYWIIENVGSGGYTFTTGALDGRTIYDNELLVKGRDENWGILHTRTDPEKYYMLDGTNAITADFQAGGHRIVNMDDGISNYDAVNLSQLNTKLSINGTAYNSERLGNAFPSSFASANHIHDNATRNTDGFMSAEDKVKLDDMGTGGGWEPFDVNVIELARDLNIDTPVAIDFHSQAESVDYNFRIIRDTGVNGGVYIIQSGTGNIEVQAPSGLFRFNNSRVWTDDYNGGGGGGWVPESINYMNLGKNVASDTYCSIELYATADTNKDALILRNSGVNGSLNITNYGNGDLNLNTSGGYLYHNSSRVWTDLYNDGGGGGDADTLDGMDSTQFARLAYYNVFTNGCALTTPDMLDGYVAWRTNYNGRNVYVGHANNGSVWYNVLSSLEGDPGSAVSEDLNFVSKIRPWTSNSHDIGDASHYWNSIYLTNPPFVIGDESKIRNVAAITTIESDFLLSLVPKAFEVTPTGITDDLFLADQPAPETAKTQLGFLAQDIESAMIASGYSPDDFNLTSGETGNKHVNMSALIPLLVKKIQDLENRISILEAP